MHEWIIATIGMQSIGAVLVPLNTRYKGSEAAFILRKSGAKALFCCAEFLGVNYPEQLADEDLPALENTIVFQGEAAGCKPWAEFLTDGNQVDEQAVADAQALLNGDDTLDILFTSGTTGEPKGVVTTHSQNIRVFESWSDNAGLNHEDNYLIINPFFHSFGYKAGWLAAILKGARILPVKTFDLDAVLEMIEKCKVSVIPGPPTIYQSLLAHPNRGNYDISSLRLAVTGAASVPVELVERMRSELGFDTVLTAYGLTETCGVVTMCERSDSAETIATTSGKAIPGVEVRCVDGDNNEVPTGEAGEVVVRGFNVMQRYFELPEATAKTIDADGWLHTGDVAVMDERGYLRITDRIKDMFISGGFNCYPAEIENTMAGLHSIAQVAVIGVPHERMGEVAKAFIVLVPGADMSEEEVISWCRDNMANYKVPRSVEFLEAMPLNASGKVLKTALRERG
jgi:acyl-CoA synthetase (AMP-forming)/AMP-acid ligase II